MSSNKGLALEWFDAFGRWTLVLGGLFIAVIRVDLCASLRLAPSRDAGTPKVRLPIITPRSLLEC